MNTTTLRQNINSLLNLRTKLCGDSWGGQMVPDQYIAAMAKLGEAAALLASLDPAIESELKTIHAMGTLAIGEPDAFILVATTGPNEGWYLTAGNKHTSNPASVTSEFRFNSTTSTEAKEFLELWGNDHAFISTTEAKEVE